MSSSTPAPIGSPSSASTAPLRVGVVGLGWAGQTHLEAYTKIPGVEVVAIAGKETAIGEELCATYRVPQLFSDWEDLVAVDGLDAVSVAVPTFLHAPIAIGALERGLHVLTEKPMARTGDEAQKMVDAARTAGRVLDVTFNQRRRGDIGALHDLIATGEIGRPYHARASWMRRRGIPGLGSWFTNKATAGGGPMADLGVHVLDFALWLLGDPEVLTVSAAAYSELGPRGLGGSTGGVSRPPGETAAYDVEDFVSVFLRLSGGATLSLETSWAVFRDPVDLIDFSVLATDGGAELSILGATDTEVGELRVFRDVDGEIDDYSPAMKPGRGHQAVVEEFIEVVRSPERWSERDGSHGLRLARVIDAAYRSAAEGHEVGVDVEVGQG